MYAEFINIPESGQFTEKHFGNITPNCLWVKFIDKDYGEWVGSFQQGWNRYRSFIINLDKHEIAFVVANGLGYLIDITNKKQLNKQEISNVISALANDDQTLIYFNNSYDLKSIDIKGNIDVLFDDYYFEDIRLIELKDNKLYAQYRDSDRDNHSFNLEIDIITKEINDSYFDNNKKEYTYVRPKFNFLHRIMSWIKK